MRAHRTERRSWPLTIGLALVATPLGIVAASSSAAATPQRERADVVAALPQGAFVAEAAQRFGLPEALIWAVIRIESRGDPRALSPAGAMGLMQVMPDTWATEHARLGLGNNPFDARDNILAGADFLRTMRTRYGVIGMLAAYNAGPGRYEDYLHRGRPLPAETVAYVGQLAPVVTGVASVNGSTLGPPDPFAWTRAALFASRSAALPRAQFAAAAPPIAQSANADAAAPAATPMLTNETRRAIEAPSNDLFVPLTGPQS